MLEAFLNVKIRQVIPAETKGDVLPLVFQVNEITMKKNFEQWSNFWVAKRLIFHALSNGYNVPGI